MKTYITAGLYLTAERLPEIFDPFITEENAPDGCLKITETDSISIDNASLLAETENFNVYSENGNWIFAASHSEAKLKMSAERTEAQLYAPNGFDDPELELLLRIFIESNMILNGCLSLHSACVEKDGKAICFSGVSGTGKSTRAAQWVKALGFNWISGDRPAVLVPKQKVSGIPWDGKERFFINKTADLIGVFDVHRCDTFTRVRRITPQQAYNFLIKQIFVPMWDSELAMYAMMNLRKLTQTIPMYRLFCGPDEKAAEEAYDIIFNKPELIFEEEKAMKLKDGFIVRNMLGDYMVMPTGDNIAKFDGSVVINDVAAFILEKMKTPVSKDDLLEYILKEFDVDRETASADLDKLIETLKGYDMIDFD